MLLVSLLLAPALIAVAGLIGRRLGPSAAGWSAALPVGFGVALVTVALDSDVRSAGAMALSAASHVSAQVAFGVVFAAALRRHGLLSGLGAGAAAYLAPSSAIVFLPQPLAIATALPALVLAPRLMALDLPRPASAGHWSTSVLTCAAASIVVAAGVLTARTVGPHAAGAVAAFPTMCTTLAVAVVLRDGRLAGAHSLSGLVRSLPCYLVFCVAVAVLVPAAGLGAVAAALCVALAAGAITWRGVPLAPRTVLVR